MKRLLTTWWRSGSTAEEREMQLRRLLLVETNIMLPVKLVAIFGALYFYRTVMRGGMDSAAVAGGQIYFTQLNFYAAGNLIFWVLLLAAWLGRTWPRVLRFSAFSLALLDNLFLSGLIYFTGGLGSPLYWLFLALFIRSAINFPLFWQQLVLNWGACLFYTLSVMLREETWQFFSGELYWLRLMLLVLLGICCWAVNLLLQRERRRSATSQEVALREQRITAAGRLAAEIAHQLKNPLGIISNAAYLLETQLATTAAAAEPVGIIRDEVTRSDRILTELMNYARLSEGRIESLDVNECVERALAQAVPSGLPPRVQVLRDLAPDLPQLPAQRAELEECFLNLIKNGIEAMPQGGTLTVRTRYAGHGRVEFQSADTGGGIPPAALPRVFEAFYTTKDGGTGLGLAIVKNLVENYGGTIAVDSTMGRGSQFTVVLPVSTTGGN
ncbi:hypothetical protein HQ590_03085 [bacterium]|nr:hypothetical protein [bacterium]